MKAWKYTRKLTDEAIPVLLTEEEQTWTESNKIEEANDFLLSLEWDSCVPGSGAPESVIVGAVQSLENMGYDVEELEELLPLGLEANRNKDYQTLNSLTAKLKKKMREVKIIADHPYWKTKVYETFEEYASKVQFPEKINLDLDGDSFSNKILAGWYSRLCGGALGTEIEGFTTKQLENKFGKISGYLRKPNTYNDDITYEIAFLESCIKAKGKPDSEKIAEQWVALVPSGWSAEKIALDNIAHGIFPPESGFDNNPYREWIGAQMRGAVCGQVSPGNPYLAAELAWMDGCVSHHGNGILGEVFNSILVSFCFVEKDLKKVLEKTIALIPSETEYGMVVRNALKECEKSNFKEVWKICEKKYEEYNWIHTYPNAAAEVVSLYFCNGDFQTLMENIAYCGQDADCNAAQIAVAIASMNGMKGIDDKWIQPFGSKIQTYIRGMKEIEIQELVLKTIDIAKMLK